jgi:hypothetical protein
MRTLSLLLTAVLLACICAPLRSQAVKGTPVNGSDPKEKVVPAQAPLLPYFSESPQSARLHAIEFRSVDQMTEKDRLQAANAESSIAESTRYADLEFNQGQWSYQQVVCPALPDHIFLRFLRNNGAGDATVFTASIPRGGEGRVRIIPIQLRGYSLFSPAPINALTISAFNHILGEENPDRDPDKAPDWLGTALCYAALAGGHPQPATLSDNPDPEKFPAVSTALLEVGSNGGAVLSFTDVSAKPRPMRWTMTFDRKGKLIKGGHSLADLLNVTVEHPLQVNQVGPPMPMAPPKAITVHPAAPAAITQVPSSPPQPVKQVPAGNPPS